MGTSDLPLKIDPLNILKLEFLIWSISFPWKLHNMLPKHWKTRPYKHWTMAQHWTTTRTSSKATHIKTQCCVLLMCRVHLDNSKNIQQSNAYQSAMLRAARVKSAFGQQQEHPAKQRISKRHAVCCSCDECIRVQQPKVFGTWHE